MQLNLLVVAFKHTLYWCMLYQRQSSVRACTQQNSVSDLLLQHNTSVWLQLKNAKMHSYYAFVLTPLHLWVFFENKFQVVIQDASPGMQSQHVQVIYTCKTPAKVNLASCSCLLGLCQPYHFLKQSFVQTSCGLKDALTTVKDTYCKKMLQVFCYNLLYKQ